MNRIIDTPKCLLVEVPEGATDFHLARSHNELWFKVNGRAVKDTKLPEYSSGSYGQPILAGEMTAKDWKRVVEDVEVAGGNYGKHYGYVNYDEDRGHDFNSALESGLSLLRSHNMKPETTVVITKL